MAKRNKPRLGYDQRGGVIAVSRFMLESKAYETLPATAKVLMQLLQRHWRLDRPISYGVREAAKRIPCTPNTASKAFRILVERGFIVCMDESHFNSKFGSKAREWRITWFPYGNDLKPSHDWEKWQPEN